MLHTTTGVPTVQSHWTLSMRAKQRRRRFLEGGKDNARKSSSVYMRLIFAASEKEIAETAGIYQRRIGEIKELSVGGGDDSNRDYSCAQYLTEGMSFLNTRGICATIGARSAARSAQGPAALEAVVAYKMPSVMTEADQAL